MNHLKIVCAVVLSLVACKKETANEASKANSSTAMKGSTVESAPDQKGAAVAPTDSKAAVAPAGTTDHSDPAKVVEQIFAAARDGKADALAGLCDPAGTGDGDVKSICALKSGDPTWERFTRDFSKGKVDGAPSIEGDTATVTFLFGRDGTKQEKMNMTRVGGKWYLGSF